MARQKVENTIKSWNGVDEALKKIGGLERRIEQANAEMQETIAKAKNATATTVKKLLAEIKLLDLQLKVFCQEHQADLGEKKSKVLNFGKVGWQYSSKIILPRKKEALEEVVQKLKDMGLPGCIHTKETPSKTEIKKLDEEKKQDLAAVGVKEQGGDAFYHEVFREKIVEAA